MKVYLVFYTTYLGGYEFLDVFATKELAEKWVKANENKEQGIELKIQEWEVRND